MDYVPRNRRIIEATKKVRWGLERDRHDANLALQSLNPSTSRSPSTATDEADFMSLHLQIAHFLHPQHFTHLNPAAITILTLSVPLRQGLHKFPSDDCTAAALTGRSVG